MTDIFISYSRQDQAWVSKLAKAFDGLGYDVWWDTQLLAGEDFQHIIPAELEKARCVVVVWSKTSVTRKWVRSEATRADNRGVLIPVRCEPAQIPMPLDLLHAEDMQGWNGKPEHPAFQKLLQAVTRHCPRPKIPDGSVPPLPPPPKKFPWFPALFLSAAVFGGGGYYWQVQGKSSVGASPAGDSPVQQINPVQKESLAGQANELAQAKATLEADDKTAWPAAVDRLNTLVKSGNTEAKKVLGIAYYTGTGVDKDQSKACSLLQQVIETKEAMREQFPKCP